MATALMSIAEQYGMKHLVEREKGKLTLSKKFIHKTGEMLEKYSNSLFVEE